MPASGCVVVVVVAVVVVVVVVVNLRQWKGLRQAVNLRQWKGLRQVFSLHMQNVASKRRYDEVGTCRQGQAVRKSNVVQMCIPLGQRGWD